MRARRRHAACGAGMESLRFKGVSAMSILDLRLSLWRLDRSASRRRGTRRQRRGRLGLETLEVRLVPATSTWLGTVDGNWATAGNWDTPPLASNDLEFPSTTLTNLTNTNNIGTGIAYGALLIGGDNYSISGDMRVVQFDRCLADHRNKHCQLSDRPDGCRHSGRRQCRGNARPHWRDIWRRPA